MSVLSRVQDAAVSNAFRDVAKGHPLLAGVSLGEGGSEARQ